LDAATSENTDWLLVGVRAKSKLGGPQRHRLYGLNSHGVIISELDVSQLATTGLDPSQSTQPFAIAGLPGDRAAVLATNRSGQISLGVTDGNKSIHGSLLTGKLEPGVSIRKAYAPKGHIVALGNGRDGGIVIDIEATKGAFSTAQIKDSDLSAAVDRIDLSDGNSVLIGRSLNTAGDNKVWLGKLAPNAGILAKRLFPGSNSRIHRGRNGIVVTYVNDQQKPTIQGYDDNLSEGTRLELPFHLGYTLAFDAGIAESYILFAGSDQDNSPLISRLTPLGAVSWVRNIGSKSGYTQVVNSRIIRSGVQWLVCFTLLEVDAAGEQREIIKALRY
jgi:hypothetical protein